MDWALNYMPVLRRISTEYEKTRPLEGIKIAMSMRIEPKFGNFARVLKSAGADVYVTSNSTTSIDDDVVAGLHKEGIHVFAQSDINAKTYKKYLMLALECYPNIIIDNSGDLLTLLHNECSKYSREMIGACVKTVMGVNKAKAREDAEKLRFPVIAANNARSQMLFNERYGTGQSVWSSIISTTNLMLAGKNVVVIGYGWCGRGVALRAIGLGANVIVCEIDPVKALEAAMDGCTVMVMEKAAKLGDIFITASGCNNVIDERHFEAMKDGALLTNAGHFDVEINVDALEQMAVNKCTTGDKVYTYILRDNKKINLIGEGRLVNLVVNESTAAEAMDLGYAVQAKCAVHVAQTHSTMQNKVYPIPNDIDIEVAHIKLQSRNITIDQLTDDQQIYLKSWEAN